MLAPGDFLTTPPEPRGEPQARRAEAVTTPEPRPGPAAGAETTEKPERESFLIKLLRALGAVHT